MSNDAVLHKNLIFNVFIRKNQKVQWRLWGKLNSSLNGHNFGYV